MNEKNLLSQLNNEFIVNMINSFQDNDNLYLVMDLLLGGDLRYHLTKGIKFNEKQLQFILACTIQGLEYLHENKILHKDIKPENLVFDSNGYIHITDLGISKIYKPANASENSGTPVYMAPEVLFNKNHDYSVDFYALGVVGYEIIMGKRPFVGCEKRELRSEILSKQPKIEENEIPEGWSDKIIDFINQLIQRKPSQRLGHNGILEIKYHDWFYDFNWYILSLQKMKPNFIPPSGENNFTVDIDSEEIGKETELLYEKIRRDKDYLKFFEDYSFQKSDIILNEKTNNDDLFNYNNKTICIRKNSKDINFFIRKNRLFKLNIFPNKKQSPESNNKINNYNTIKQNDLYSLRTKRLTQSFAKSEQLSINAKNLNEIKPKNTFVKGNSYFRYRVSNYQKNNLYKLRAPKKTSTDKSDTFDNKQKLNASLMYNNNNNNSFLKSIYRNKSNKYGINIFQMKDKFNLKALYKAPSKDLNIFKLPYNINLSKSSSLDNKREKIIISKFKFHGLNNKKSLENYNKDYINMKYA